MNNYKEWILNGLVATLAILAPIKTVMISVGALIVADFITGVWAAIKTGEPITSAAMRRTISKAFVYQIAVISGYIVEKYTMDGALPVAKIVSGAIGLVELKSILENAKTITGLDVFQSILAKLDSSNNKKD